MNHTETDSKPQEVEDMETDGDTIISPGIEMGDPLNGQEQDVDTAMDEDESRSEATFSFRIQNFSRIKESQLSPPTFIRNLPWKIMVMPRHNQQDRGQAKSLGFFLQCNGDSDSSAWTCDASADLRLLSYKDDGEPFSRRITHHFHSKENDWGFSHFLSWNDVMDSDKNYIQDDCIIVEVHVSADAPHGVSWDSKKHTGYVGLKNQGATCYMNSLLQTLYFTNQLRKAVYKMPTESDDSTKSVALALQRVFYELQFCDKPVGTKKLTKSFGWETMDSFMQHDVQEFLRVLLDKLESKMKGTCVEGTVPKLFEGKMSSYILCKSVEYSSTRLETFYDIQLNVKGKKNIYESFRDYVATEVLEGDNKYDAGQHGLQDAEKGVVFASFPPVLHLHLMRFQYDPVTDCSVKFNDRFEFDEKINLDEFIQEKGSTKADYTLHAVLVHSGDNHGGHYVVFINPHGDGKWCKFDDDVVSKCRKEAAIESNYGGHGEDDSNLTIRSCTNAYMLVYIRDSELKTVLQEVAEEDIPQELTDRLTEEKRLEQIRRKERTESHLYLQVNVVLEDEFEGHQGNDLFNQDKVHSRVFRVKKKTTLPELMEMFSETFKYPVARLRPWPITSRTNPTKRPTSIDFENDRNKTIIELAENFNPWTIYLEMLPPDSPLPALPPFTEKSDVLLFFKLYDPKQKQLHYAGHLYAPVHWTPNDLVPILNKRAGFPLGTKLILYEEIKPNSTVIVDKWDEPLEKCLEDIMDGDIICFQKDNRADWSNYELPTCKDYFEDYHHRVEVLFCDKAVSLETGFTMNLSLKMMYGQMAEAVADRLGTSPSLLQFFKCQNYKDSPGTAIRCNADASIKDLLIYSKPKSVKRVFYQHLSIPIDELENKKQFKCIWVPENLKEEKEVMLYPNKQGTVVDLLEEAKKICELSPNGTGKLRIFEIASAKIGLQIKEDVLLATLNPTHSSLGSVYRIEEIPHDELDLAEDETLLPVAHYQKEIFSTFGIPFFVKVKHNEPFSKVKDRIFKKLDVSEKEFDKYKFAIVISNKPKLLGEDGNDFIMNFNEINKQAQKPWIGLDHVNKAPKRSRFNYLEKAIKIYN